MNETNIKHGYTSMDRDARDAILNPVAQIWKAGAQFMQPVRNRYWSQGRNTGAPQGQDFLTMLAPGRDLPRQVVHSGLARSIIGYNDILLDLGTKIKRITLLSRFYLHEILDG